LVYLGVFKGVGQEIPCRITQGLGALSNPAGAHANLALLVVIGNLQNEVPDLRELSRSRRFKQRTLLLQERVVNALGSCCVGHLVIFHEAIPIGVEDPLVCLVFYFIKKSIFVILLCILSEVISNSYHVNFKFIRFNFLYICFDIYIHTRNSWSYICGHGESGRICKDFFCVFLVFIKIFHSFSMMYILLRQ
jgi:hypothetical protein